MLEISDLRDCAGRARAAVPALTALSNPTKNDVLLDLADRLLEEADRVLEANAADTSEARDGGMEPAMLDRLLLTPARLEGIAGDARHVASLPDPVGEEFDTRTLPSGLQIRRQRVPL